MSQIRRILAMQTLALVEQSAAALLPAAHQSGEKR
jgi:hypothetical protein